jgi:hypothetical protein
MTKINKTKGYDQYLIIFMRKNPERSSFKAKFAEQFSPLYHVQFQHCPDALFPRTMRCSGKQEWGAGQCRHGYRPL